MAADTNSDNDPVDISRGNMQGHADTAEFSQQLDYLEIDEFNDVSS